MLKLGHEVEIGSEYVGQDIDWLVCLHAQKSGPVVAACRQAGTRTRIAVVLTGTDIYPEPTDIALETMHRADVLVGLQEKAAEQLPEELRAKVRVIVQASEKMGPSSQEKSLDPFDVCVVGHLRDVKDPLLTAVAARMLPEESRIRIRHAGAVLDSKYEALIEQEYLKRADNDRSLYQYLA